MERWIEEGYGRPQSFATLDSGIHFPAPPRGHVVVFLRLMSVLMVGLESISGGLRKGWWMVEDWS